MMMDGEDEGEEREDKGEDGEREMMGTEKRSTGER